jgi:Ca-activated chloride channel family protein
VKLLRRFSALPWLIVAVLQLVASGQSQPSTTIPPSPTKMPVDLVSLVFVVTDDRGQPVTDLKKEQLTVLDNGKPPKRIAMFESSTSLPARLGLIIDASNSEKTNLPLVEQAVEPFIRKIVRPGADKAFVLAFDEVFELIADLTDDQAKLAAGIRNIHPGGGTAVWDTLYFACREKLLKERNTTPVRRVIVLISDGDDNQSHVTYKEALEMAEMTEVTIYAISTGGGRSSPYHHGDGDLKGLAEATGGKAFFPHRVSDLKDALDAIADDLRTQYSISYEPDDLVRNGKFRTVKIESADRKLKVRARKGYFTPRQ